MRCLTLLNKWQEGFDDHRNSLVHHLTVPFYASSACLHSKLTPACCRLKPGTAARNWPTINRAAVITILSSLILRESYLNLSLVEKRRIDNSLGKPQSQPSGQYYELKGIFKLQFLAAIFVIYKITSNSAQCQRRASSRTVLNLKLVIKCS